MASLGYIVETNGENGVLVFYHPLNYVPQDVEWDAHNTVPNGSVLPNPELYDSPEYVRRIENGTYAYYRRSILVPSKPSTFSLYVLRDGTRSEYSYEEYSSFLTLFRQGDALLVKSRANVSGSEREGAISLALNIDGGTLIVPIVQEYEPVRMMLLGYRCECSGGEEIGTINNVRYEHTFHYLTNQMSPNKERLEIDVKSTGPRSNYVIRDISEFVYVGEVGVSGYYSSSSGTYFQTTTTCDGGNVLIASEELIFDNVTEGIYKKVEYCSDLKVVKNGSTIIITNYGRCFLQNDAYYVITLSNVDDLRESCHIIIRYVDASNGDIIIVNPNMYLSNGSVILETDNELDASEFFSYDVEMENGQLVFTTSNPEVLMGYIINNELVTVINT